MSSPFARRRLVNRLVSLACIVATLFAIVPLVSILFYVVKEGIPGLSWEFFTRLPQPVGESGGGMANAIVGTLVLVGLACVVGIPVGVLGGIYLAEFGSTKFATALRFSSDVLAGVPSIVVGMFVYEVLVVPMGRQSAHAGGVALGILMIPTVIRTTEELLKLVPDTLREAALALGVPKWRAIIRVVLRTAAPGIATGVMLAIARATGETAPLLFTAANNRFWVNSLDQPIASLTVQIYQYSVSPYEDWHRQAWTAALVLVTIVLFLDIGARALVRQRPGARAT
jgi:phosphate transport system permease protein